MRQLAVYFALFYWFLLGISGIWPGEFFRIKNFIINPLPVKEAIKDRIQLVFGYLGSNPKHTDNGKDDREILKKLLKICFKEISLKNGNSGTDAKDIHLNTSNINSLESNIKLPTIKMPNITVIIVDDEHSEKCSNNHTSNCQGQKYGAVLQRTKQVNAAQSKADEFIKKCVAKELRKSKP